LLAIRTIKLLEISIQNNIRLFEILNDNKD